MAGATSGRLALRAAMETLFAYEKSLAAQLIEGLLDIDGVTVQGITSPDAFDRRVPTVAITHDRTEPTHIAESLARENIFVWKGHNYAIEAAKALNIYETGGAVRIGPVHYNSAQEIDETLAALRRILGQ
jgi:selenocysteine lyase/cysteine desulfurase